MYQSLIPNVETQVMFNEATQISYKISFDEWYTEGRVISDTITHLDFGTSQYVNSPRYLIGAHQTRTTAYTANKNNNIAIFDNIISIFKNILLNRFGKIPTR